MAANDRKSIRRLLTVLLTGAAVCAYVCSTVENVYAQSAGVQLGTPKIADDAKLLLSANELVYNHDADKVSAVGAVQINYGGYQMVAQKVEYNQKTGRLTAIGNIEMVEPGGNRIYAENMDLTDNFAEGFVNALRVETPDNTRMAAESGERVPGDVMILNNGIYTACLPCAENPDKPPLWQIKAQRVIQNGQKHTIRLEHAKFELFGHPLAFIPSIEVPDNTVKRKSGFLFPEMTTSQNLGFGLTIPYYQVITNSMDATIRATGYTNQGFMLETDFRQRLENGTHSLRIAGINQANPGAFTAGTSDAEAKQRGMIQSKGDFTINPRWAFGWDAMLQSDNNFARTYDLDGLHDSTHTNQAYLTGRGDRNHFDARAYYFDIQDADNKSTAEHQQAKVLPVIDYGYYAPTPVAGGQLSMNANFTSLSRSRDDVYTVDGVNRFRGISGDYSRLSAEMEWKRTFIEPGGLVLTPLLAARGDALNFNMALPSSYAYLGTYDHSDTITRGLLTAGMEARYPILMTTDNSTHIFEPIAQLYVRNDEQFAGQLPNEDAQSFVFDATSLFDRDKFSGYDRMEGGTRANVGIRYTGSFDSGYRLRSILGQSYQVAGLNSFATEDLVNVGANSGLQNDVSDYVAMFGIDTPFGVSLATNVRVDKDTFDVNRNSTTLSYSNRRLFTSVTYTDIAPQPLYGSAERSSEVQTAASFKLDANWSVNGSLTWDLNNNVVSRRTAGFAYGDECTVLSINYIDSADVSDQSASDWKIKARLTFRTLGDITLGGE